jgi:hypothetical protein
MKGLQFLLLKAQYLFSIQSPSLHGARSSKGELVFFCIEKVKKKTIVKEGSGDHELFCGGETDRPLYPDWPFSLAGVCSGSRFRTAAKKALSERDFRREARPNAVAVLYFCNVPYLVTRALCPMGGTFSTYPQAHGGGVRRAD